MVCDKCFGAANGDCDACERRKRDIDVCFAEEVNDDDECESES